MDGTDHSHHSDGKRRRVDTADKSGLHLLESSSISSTLSESAGEQHESCSSKNALSTHGQHNWQSQATTNYEKPTMDDERTEFLRYLTEFVGERLRLGATEQSILDEFKIPHAASVAGSDVVQTLFRWLTSDSDAQNTEPDAEHYCGALVEPYNKKLLKHLQYIKTKSLTECLWQPHSSNLRVVLNVAMDFADVPLSSDPGRTRRDASHVVVLDNLFGEQEQDAFRALLNPQGEAWDDGQNGPCPDTWERKTCDADGLPPTWGLRKHVVDRLRNGDVDAAVEVQTRLQRLYPEYDIAHMTGGNISGSSSAEPFVGNAAVAGDAFQWHRFCFVAPVNQRRVVAHFPVACLCPFGIAQQCIPSFITMKFVELSCRFLRHR
eukprot:m.516189 g.516189  ORF g.516189 m.516189 type:complete len:378 (+) comp21927_c3_seq11:456-1589(+)